MDKCTRCSGDLIIEKSWTGRYQVQCTNFRCKLVLAAYDKLPDGLAEQIEQARKEPLK